MTAEPATTSEIEFAEPVTKTVPVQPDDRIASIDVLRGVVVLGILFINIWGFGLPSVAFSNPTLLHEFTNADTAMYWLAWVGFEGSQRAIFSMLFGAGIVLLTSRLASDERAQSATSIYYRRNVLLLCFGLVDCYLLLWYGDILFIYGLVGLFLYFARNAAPWKLLTAAGVIFVVMALWNFGLGVLLEETQDLIEPAKEKLERGETLTDMEQTAIDLNELSPGYQPSPQEIEEAIQSRSNGYFAALGPNATLGFEMSIVLGILSLWWDAAAMMLVGMALFKLRVFDASRSVKTYLMMTILGLAVGLSVNAWETADSIASGYATMFLYWTYDLGRLSMALGTIGLIMLICKTGFLARVQTVFAAVGRMALTNYIAQTVICNVLFIGFGLFAVLTFHQLYYVVLAVWALQLLYSPLWLKRHRYGPMEWLWRKLTYLGKL